MKGSDTVEKVKKYSKYLLNILTIVNALLVGISPIWDIPADRVIETISVIMAVISTYLLGNKAFKSMCERGNGNDAE